MTTLYGIHLGWRIVSLLHCIYICRVIPAGGDDSVAAEQQMQCRPDNRGHAPKSKVSRIKKILNKKMKLNSHIKFDDQEQMLEEESTAEPKNAADGDADSITPVPISQYESQGDEGRTVVGGIRIEEAQKKLQTRDRIDRGFEKERIHQVHRERRLKRKKQRVSDGVDNGVRDGVSLAESGQDDDSSARLGEGRLGRKRKRKPSEEQGEKRRKGGEEMEKELGEGGGEGGVEPGRKKRGEEVGSWGGGKNLGTNSEGELLDDEELAKHLLGL